MEGRRDKGDWREEGGTKVIEGRKEGEGCLERGKKEKDAWREERRRRMTGERKEGEG